MEHTLAIACLDLWRGPQSWKISGQLQDLTLLLGGDGALRLELEVGKLRLEVEHALCRIISALLKRAGDQPILLVNCLVAAFGHSSFVASALDAQPPRGFSAAVQPRGKPYAFPYTGTTAPRVTRLSGDARNRIVAATSSTFGQAAWSALGMA
jgi:hypothetical protein